ncbi:expressed unknown protein [Seminavis robusta]|uniref:Uncharacterized protein n=1 Tax=Seminavis robusta TaxID=568900 RepID=A0A9N8EQY6_9STRA|nr:expressed unknown protein [Seminavis robusta]|eukprot:Sro1468_g275230.1 n/a (172) ;mRNA; r:20065-20580
MISPNTIVEESETGFELKKSVSWKNVHVREYNLTVGDHPLCRDNLPLTLDWAHRNEKVKHINTSRERKANYVFPKRLSYEDRKKRLYGDDASVSSDKSQESISSVSTSGTIPARSLMDLIEGDKAHTEASNGVFYCRHAIKDEAIDGGKSSNDTDEDSLSYFLDWRRFAGY